MANIFLSRPTQIGGTFESGFGGFTQCLQAHGLSVKTVGSTNTPIRNPLDEVIALMRKCVGAIILGYPQIEIASGSIKGTAIANPPLYLSTEWNHIEAALAHASNLPMLIIHHSGLKRGVFDRGATSSFLHEIDMRDPAWCLNPQVQGAIESLKACL